MTHLIADLPVPVLVPLLLKLEPLRVCELEPEALDGGTELVHGDGPRVVIVDLAEKLVHRPALCHNVLHQLLLCSLGGHVERSVAIDELSLRHARVLLVMTKDAGLLWVDDASKELVELGLESVSESVVRKCPSRTRQSKGEQSWS